MDLSLKNENRNLRSKFNSLLEVPNERDTKKVQINQRFMLNFILNLVHFVQYLVPLFRDNEQLNQYSCNNTNHAAAEQH
jgi:hypothetical protein